MNAAAALDGDTSKGASGASAVVIGTSYYRAFFNRWCEYRRGGAMSTARRIANCRKKKKVKNVPLNSMSGFYRAFPDQTFIISLFSFFINVTRNLNVNR